MGLSIFIILMLAQRLIKKKKIMLGASSFEISIAINIPTIAIVIIVNAMAVAVVGRIAFVATARFTEPFPNL